MTCLSMIIMRLRPPVRSPRDRRNPFLRTSPNRVCFPILNRGRDFPSRQNPAHDLFPSQTTKIYCTTFLSSQKKSSARRCSFQTKSSARRCSFPDKILRTTFWNYCTVRAQNKLTSCCDFVDFANQIATGCTDACQTNCIFSEYQQFCNDRNWIPCSVTRRPFSVSGSRRGHCFDLAAPILLCIEKTPLQKTIQKFKLTETFCLPDACNNDADLAGTCESLHLRYHCWRRITL